MKLEKLIRLFLLPVLFFGLAGLQAQTEEETEEEIQTLSPFEVDGAADIGYRATSTLAGTRINTQLNEIGSSISIVNKELLDDTASTSLVDVLVITPNTEVAGLSGNFSGSQGFGAGNPIPELNRDQQQGGVTRIRGLAAADLTRNYFITDIPFDTYNVDRIAVQRGANSALYGLGSPGGIVNHTLIRANFLRNSGQVRLGTDSYGTFRGSFRANYEVIDDTLAVTVAGLYQDKAYEQKQAYGEDTRFFASVMYKPLKEQNINLFANVEWGDRKESRPDFTPPNDGITPWIQAGKPTFDSPAEAAEFFRGNGDIVPGVNNNLFYTLAASGASSGFVAMYTPENPNMAFGGNTFVRGGRNVPGAGGPNGELMILQPRPLSDTIRRTGFLPNGQAVPDSDFWNTGFVTQQIQNRDIFDYRENLFSGGASPQLSDWTAFTLGIDGSFFDNRLGFEAAYFDQKWFEEAYNSLQGQFQRLIYIDPNRYLIGTTNGAPDGPMIPNPNFGKPVMGGLSGGNNRIRDRQNFRLTAFGELAASDFMDEDQLLTQILGRFRLTGLFERRDFYGEVDFGQDKIDRTQVVNALAGGDFSAMNTASFRQGMLFGLPHNNGFDFLGMNSIRDAIGANIGGVTFGNERQRPPATASWTSWNSVDGRYVSFDAQTYTLRDNNSFPSSFSSSKSKERLDSSVLVGQYYFWDDLVILMGTWRKDKQETASIGAPGFSGYNRSDDVFDPAYVAFDNELAENANEETTSWSVMVNTPDFISEMIWDTEISVYASEAENFQPSGNRVDVLNNPISPVTGSTEEFGIIINTLEGTLNARFNWYETGVLNNSFDVGGVSSNEGILLNLAFQLDNPANIAQGFTQADVEAVLPPQGVIDLNDYQPDFPNATATTNRNPSDNGTQDFTSEGFEFEITYNPIPNWTNLFGISKQETVTSNTYPVLSSYVDDFVIPTWINSNFAQNYFIDDAGTTTLAQRAQDTIVDPVTRAKTQDGIPTIEQRTYRFTYHTSYNFGVDSFLPDWAGNLTVGGAVRWEDELGIGFGVGTNELGEPALDPDQPFFGRSQMFIDAFVRSRWNVTDDQMLTVQLNVNDLTNHNGLIPFFANPDGSELYRFTQGRLFTLTATYDF